jgi:transcriptional regulator with XRE-family HTH domain
VTSRASPTVRRRRLGIELRRLREQAGITIDTGADRSGFSSSKVSRIETGHIGASPRDVRDILAIYGVHGGDADELVQVARQARQKGWWHLYGPILTGAYIGLEAEATVSKAYEAQLVPGLLQTPEYAGCVIRAAKPDIRADELSRRVELRMKRQALLIQDEPLELWVVLDEAAIRRLVGSPDVMRGQLEHLVSATALANVTVQVLAFAAGAHAGMDGTFSILEYTGTPELDVVFAENAAGGLFLEKEEELQRYKVIFNDLCASARSPEESAEMLADRAREL